MPKILPDGVPLRTVVRDPQLAEQLVDVPTNRGYALAVIASKVFSRREVRGFLSGQGSTASGSRSSEQVVDNPFPQGRPGGSGGFESSVSQDRIQQQRNFPQARFPHRIECMAMQMREFKGVPHFFPGPKKVRMYSASRVRECPLVTSNGSGRGV